MSSGSVDDYKGIQIRNPNIEIQIPISNAPMTKTEQSRWAFSFKHFDFDHY
jgi:hypothetical protein